SPGATAFHTQKQHATIQYATTLTPVPNCRHRPVSHERTQPANQFTLSGFRELHRKTLAWAHGVVDDERVCNRPLTRLRCSASVARPSSPLRHALLPAGLKVVPDAVDRQSAPAATRLYVPRCDTSSGTETELICLGWALGALISDQCLKERRS